jgi:hypothetical protein
MYENTLRVARWRIPMPTLSEALQDLETERLRLRAALDALGGSLEALRAATGAGEPLARTVPALELPLVRARTLDAHSGFERAFRRARAAVVAELHDREGLSFTEIANLIGVSRQFVSRMYSDLNVNSSS